MIIWGIFLFLICYGKCEIIRMKLERCRGYNSTRISLTHLAVDDEGEAVFVAGTNCLYRLDKQLKALQSVSTGPEEDSVLCSARGSCQAGAIKRPTDNLSKVLLVDQAERSLLFCGSLFQGTCNRVPVDDIGRKEAAVPVAIASNDALSNTVAFIGPGLPDARSHRVLYVASPHTQQGPYRSQEEIPILSSRNIKTLEIIRARRFVQARIKMASQWLETFHIKYIAGFYLDGYAYFAMVQPASAENPDEGFVSKLGRVCANDPSYESYMEITLQCQSKGSTYNLLQSVHLIDHAKSHVPASSNGDREKMLVGAFSASESNSASSKASSAVCVFSMKDLHETFAVNARQCFSGSRISRGLGFVAGANLPCPKDPRTVSDFCNEHLMIEGNIPAQSEAILTYLDDTVTALTSTHSPAKETDHLVLFLGTRRGLVRNVLLKSPHIAVEYGQTDLRKSGDVTGHVRALHPDRTGRFLYVITESEVLRMEVGQCSSYSKCDECLQSGDPFCGWCSTENRCTQRQACGRGLTSSSVEHWLPLGSHQCIDFVSLQPDRVSAHRQAVTVQLLIRELPPVPKYEPAWYMCIVRSNVSSDEHLAVVPAAVTGNGLSCSFSPAALCKDWIAKASTDHVVTSLAVQTKGTNRDIARRDLFFYNCDSHKRCNSCVVGGSKWNCSWCASSHRCLDSESVDEVCFRDQINAVDSCPSISPTSSALASKNPAPENSEAVNVMKEPTTRSPILMANMAAKPISLRLRKLTPTKNAVYECLLETEERVIRVAAALNGTDTVVCQGTACFYDAEIAQMSGMLSVVWNWHHYVDTLNVSLYKCRLKGPDCSLCMSLDPAYQCMWQNDECQYSKDGPDQQSEHICPAPVIETVSPVSGPVEGGTLVQITGRELGMTMDELKDAITVAGVPCRPVQFEISKRVLCRTDPAPQLTTRTGPVVIQLSSRPAHSSVHKFYFLNASMSHLTPRVGIKSGGTRVTVSGNHLDIGSNLSLTIGSVPCPIIPHSVTATRLACRIGAAPQDPIQRGATLQIDGMRRFLDVEYLYVDDPVITDITPTTSFVSGGAILRISGENFAAVQAVRLGVSRGPKDDPVNWSQCEVQSPRLLLCPAPVVLVSGSELEKKVLRMNTKVEIDGWTSRFAEEGMKFILNYLPDPVVISFDEADNTRLFQGEVLLLQGKGLTSGTQAMELYVTVGDDFCNVTSISSSQIICRPGVNKAGTAEPVPVVVHIGQLALQAGYLRYPSAEILVGADVLTGAAVGAGLFLLLSLTVLVFFRRRSSKAEREYKRIQTQLDTLETHVRLECKQAFAELQTNISDLTSELQATGMPYVDLNSYLMKIFFPLCHDHPVLQDVRPCRNNRCTGFEQSMQQFEQLLCREEFLVSFIGALEDQRSFGIRDRANVASLLMLVLLDKLDYFTGVLGRLLRELMQRVVDSKHPQLMLRRSECILEKMMSNWMALCMHDYVIDHVGQSLFLLTQAVKCQGEKGPVDCLNHQARYTLCEDHLLREQVMPSSIVVDLIQDDLDEKIQCRVLDCDSISQVKAKLLDALYRSTTPASTRPSLYEIDLEWHCNRSRVILNDEDSSSQMTVGWRRVNTLAHYGIGESAVMTLVLRSQEHAFSVCEISPYSISAMPSLSPGKMWHLTRGSSNGACGSSGGGFSATGTGIPEIFLTRLISTKGTLQKYIDDLFVAKLSVNEDFPSPVKWLFDLFDQFGQENGQPTQTVCTWKSNSLPLRFWVNLIKNPELLLDINKSPSVESSLAVVAQTLMESCSLSDSPRLDRDSPCSKLLFAKDVPQYRKMLQGYYDRIRNLPSVSDAQLSHYMATLSKKYMFQMNITNALKELFSYAVKYRVEILEKLEENVEPKDNCSVDISQTFEALCDVASGSYFTMPGQSAHWETMSRAVYHEPAFLAEQNAHIHNSTAQMPSGYSVQYEKLNTDYRVPRL